MPAERRNPAVGNSSIKMGGTDEMIKASISVQDLRRRIYIKAKAEPAWRFARAKASAGRGGVGNGCMKQWGYSMTTRFDDQH
jgi:hypothetical protein